jgi:hypothetical protein
MTLKRTPNALKRGPKRVKQAGCYVSFGMNEAHFYHNSFNAKQLPLWWVPAVGKALLDKGLNAILVFGSASIFRKSLSDL